MRVSACSAQRLSEDGALVGCFVKNLKIKRNIRRKAIISPAEIWIKFAASLNTPLGNSSPNNPKIHAKQTRRAESQ